MTPDSSRYWPKDHYTPGGPQPSFDKQYVRDYLEQIKWNKQPPVPSLPDDVVMRTRDKYLEAFRRLSGKEVRCCRCAINSSAWSMKWSTRASATTKPSGSSRKSSSCRSS